MGDSSDLYFVDGSPLPQASRLWLVAFSYGSSDSFRSRSGQIIRWTPYSNLIFKPRMIN